jgi:glycosyltransferase involved in cell wall biosynthesis
MKVSINIPTYNQSQYIRQTVESALAQDYPNLEINVSDDCSTDDTENVLNDYLSDSRLTYIKNNSNLGRVGNYHKLLYEYASGDFVLNLDGDDYFTDTAFISKAVKLIEKTPELVLVFAKSKTFFESNQTVIEDKANASLPTIVDGDHLFINYPKGYRISHMTSLYKRSSAMEIDYYSSDTLSADWESVLRLIQGNKVGFINSFIGIWRKHPENASRSFDLNEITKNVAYIESPYRFAMEKQQFTPAELQTWRNAMLTRYFVKHLTKMTLAKSNKLPKLKAHIKSAFPELYYKIVYHPFLLAIRLFSKNRTALNILFRDVLKMESLLTDFTDMKE